MRHVIDIRECGSDQHVLLSLFGDIQIDNHFHFLAIELPHVLLTDLNPLLLAFSLLICPLLLGLIFLFVLFILSLDLFLLFLLLSS